MRKEQLIRDFLVQLESHARGMWRYRWHSLVFAWLICIAGWIAVYSMPNTYAANARIFVDAENALRPLLRGIATSSNVIDEVNVVTREMLSRPNLAQVARDTDLDLRATTEQEFEDLLQSLQSKISVAGSRENIFSISYSDSDRDVAVAVVDSLVNTFIEKSLGAERTESSAAQAFLREQIQIYEERLTAAEQRLAEFKQENVAVMPGQQGDYFQRMQRETDLLTDLQNDLRVAIERRNELQRQFEGEEPVFGIMPDNTAGADAASTAKMRELEAQLEELRLRYTDKHPQIQQILGTLDLLRQQGAEARAAASSAGVSASPALEMNPVYQNLQIQLNGVEVEIASLEEEVRQQRRKVSELRGLVDSIPDVEARLNQLNRDYDVVKTKHQQLLQQLESASIGEDVEASMDDLQIRVIEPPFAGAQPDGPNRPLFITAVLMVGFGAALAVGFLLNQLHPVFFGSRAITTVSGMPVLGAVRLTLTDPEMRAKRRSRLRFAVALGLLVTSYALITTFANSWSPALRSLGGLVA